jgi:hypothetical protein
VARQKRSCRRCALISKEERRRCRDAETVALVVDGIPELRPVGLRAASHFQITRSEGSSLSFSRKNAFPPTNGSRHVAGDAGQVTGGAGPSSFSISFTVSAISSVSAMSRSPSLSKSRRIEHDGLSVAGSSWSCVKFRCRRSCRRASSDR